MNFGVRKTGAAISRLTGRKPEQLWLHYCFALLLTMGLIVAAHSINQAVIGKGVVSAETIKISNRQMMLAREILREVEDFDKNNSAHAVQLNKSINQLKLSQAALPLTELRSPALHDLYLGGEDPLFHRLRLFITLSETIADGSSTNQAVTVQRIKTLYDGGRLHADLSHAATLFTEQAKAETSRFLRIQRFVFWISAIVLIGEAVFIFLPAHLTVQSSITQLRHQTSTLRESQKKLRQMNGKLKHLAHHDHLTGLPNRASLAVNLGKQIAAHPRDELCLLYVGLDDFKSVNDSMGHDYGDALLVAVAKALQSCVDHDNLIARVGGDEFVLASDEPVDVLIKRITASLAEPFEILGRSVHTSACIGHITIEKNHPDPLTLVANSEMALHIAKGIGRGLTQAYTDHLRIDMEMMHKLQADLHDAIKNGEIEPWFQPQVRLSDGTLHGAEVLARWRHPTRGLLAPYLFLPAAEREGLMIELDHAVWKKAMTLAREWDLEGIWRPTISLNAAPDTISDPLFIERFLVALTASGLDINQVVVEVLETTLIDGKGDMAAINIDSLAEVGIALELDDFGTGYASLSRLAQLPLTGIKLDRSLVAPLPEAAADSIVRAILALALELGLHVIAEGVEEVAQADHLNNLRCGLAQGYGFGRPMPPADFRSWLVENANSTLEATG